jgi:hypothetical protein
MMGVANNDEMMSIVWNQFGYREKYSLSTKTNKKYLCMRINQVQLTTTVLLDSL